MAVSNSNVRLASRTLLSRYFTADPDPAKVNYRHWGFGFAQSKDGVTREALPPVSGDISGDAGGGEKSGTSSTL